MLSVGVHLTVFLVVPFVAVFFSLKREASHNDWGVIAGFFVFELLLIMVLTGSYANYRIFLGLSAVAFVGVLFYVRNKIHWPVLLSFAALSPIMIGFYPFLVGPCDPDLFRHAQGTLAAGHADHGRRRHRLFRPYLHPRAVDDASHNR